MKLSPEKEPSILYSNLLPVRNANGDVLFLSVVSPGEVW